MAIHLLLVLCTLTLQAELCLYGQVLVGRQLTQQVLTQRLLSVQLLFLLERR